MQEEPRSENPTQFSLILKIPSGLTDREIKQRVQAALFALNGAARDAAVEIVKGPFLERYIETHLTG